MKNLPAHLKHRVIPQFERAETVLPVSYDLPFPISINGAYKNVPGKGRAKTKRHISWANVAGVMLKEQKPKRFKVPVEITVYLEERRNADCSNFFKVVEDLLVDHGVIKDDNLEYVRSTRQVWSPETKGCRVSIRPAPMHGEAE